MNLSTSFIKRYLRDSNSRYTCKSLHVQHTVVATLQLRSLARRSK